MTNRASVALTEITPTGEPLASATIAFYEEDGTTPLAATLYAANAGGSSAAPHITNAKGQLLRFAQYPQRASYTVNGDAVKWPITLDAHPADVAAFDADGATLTRGYRALARMRVTALEAKVRDMGGVVHHVDAYAAGLGLVVNDGVGDPDAAINAALAAIGSNPGVIQFGPGTYLAPSGAVVWPSNIVVRGAGRGVTILKHRDSSAQPVILLPLGANTTNFTVKDLTVDGNRSGGTNVDYNNSEISLEATGPAHQNTDCAVIDVEVKNFNKVAVAPGGLRATVHGCHIYVDPPTDPYANLATFPTRFGGAYGINPSGATVSEQMLISDCVVHGLRSAAITPGGRGMTVIGCRLKDNHRGDFPAGVNGSQLAPTTSMDAAGNPQLPVDVLILDTIVEDETYGTYSGGMEFDSCTNVVVDGCIIRNQYAHGIKIASSGGACTDVTISNTKIDGISRNASAVTAGGSVGVAMVATSAIRVVRLSNVSIANCRNLAYMVGDVDAVSFLGVTQNNNTAGLTVGGGVGANIQSGGGNLYLAGAGAAVPLPNQIYVNTHGTDPLNGGVTYAQRIINADPLGYGLRIDAATTSASQFLLNVANGNTAAFTVFGNGQTRFGGAANGQLLDLKWQTEELTLSTVGATTDTAMQMPAGAVIFGVTTRVTQALTVATSFSVGDSGSATRFSTTGTVAVTLGTTDKGTKAGAYYNASALAVRVTANGGTPGAGKVRLTMWYYELTPSTS
jgi:hypothetical protein